MKNKWKFLICVILILLLVGCEKNAQPTWQKQYDLGMKYLEEGDYEQAIVAFTAAIEIDSKQAAVYAARADSYMALENQENNLQLAQNDYETAIELDGTDIAVYTKLADIYLQTGNYEQAETIINSGQEKIGKQEEFSKYEQKIQEAQSFELSDITILKLERLFRGLYYYKIGNGFRQLLSQMTTSQLEYQGVFYVDYIDNEQTDSNALEQPDIFNLCKGTYVDDWGTEYRTTTEEALKQFFYDCFGAEFVDYTYDLNNNDWFLKKDDIVYARGADGGFVWPFAKVTDYQEEGEELVVRGTAGEIRVPNWDDDSALHFGDPDWVTLADIEAVLVRTNSKYLDGYTIQSFKYTSYNAE